MKSTNWAVALKPLIDKYKGKKHPLDYKNTYQLLVMVILSAQDSDRHINSLAPELFKEFPSLKVLSNSNVESLIPYISKVRNFGNKANWIIQIAKTLKEDKNIPLTMDGLTALPGIGRKSANVIMRESGKKAEGIIVDLHVVRVAPRLGIATGTDPKKIETQLMEAMPESTWGQIGMAISFLGRETCRPTNPKHEECVVRQYCEYCRLNGGNAAVLKSKKPSGNLAPVKKKVIKKETVKEAERKKTVGKNKSPKKLVSKNAMAKIAVPKIAVKKTVATKTVRKAVVKQSTSKKIELKRKK
jgi:endonuclease-3